MGRRHARRLALTTGRIGAQEAREIGLVHRVADAAGLDAAVDSLLAELLQSGPAALGEIKALFSELELGPVTSQVRELTAQTISRVRMTPEAKEGFAAFFDKRPPSWMTDT